MAPSGGEITGQGEGRARAGRALSWRSRAPRVLVALAFAVTLLTLWHSTVQGRARVAPPTPQAHVVREAGLRSAVVVGREEGKALLMWRAPTIGHVSPLRQEGTRVSFMWTPAGAATAACASHITIDLTTRDIITSSPPTCLPSISNLQSPVSESRDWRLEIGQGSLLPPPVIRVYHDPRNTCRDVPPGRVDVIPFEEYVARVVPAEMPALWPMEALKAQAIAVRTYAWYHVLRARPDWDVSDWSNFQVMCDTRHPRSDAAVAATEGQAITFDGRPILAFYSAQNGHPTLDDPWRLPYIAPVPDPVGLGRPRSGHGLGLSQYGAKGWAVRGWNAYQILAHYYPGTTLTIPPQSPTAVGTLLPPELENMTLGRGYPLYAFLASPRPLAAITVTAQVDDAERVVLTRTGPITPFLGVWIPDETLTSTRPITLSASIVDTAGISSTLGQAIVWRDLRPLTVSLQTVSETVDKRLPFTVNAQMPLTMPFALGVSDNWLWEEGDFRVSPPGAGHVVTDGQALDGWAWEHPKGHAPAILYGPYTDALEPDRAYRAWFRLWVDEASSPEVVAFLDVVDDEGRTLLGLRALRGIEFPGGGRYREFPVDFYLFPRETPRRVEFRVHTTGKVTLRVDRVLVTTLPQVWEETSRWIVPESNGVHTLIAKATTRSGVVAADVPLSVTLHVPDRPLGFVPPTINGWISNPLTLTWRITTAVSPPNPTTFAFRYARGGGPWSPWHPMLGTLVNTRTAEALLPTNHLPEGKDVRVQVRGEDTFAYRATSEPLTLSVDVTPPVLRVLPWRQETLPATIVVHASDVGIGLRDLEIGVVKANAPARRYTIFMGEPVHVLTYTITLTETGMYTLLIRARDALGKSAEDVYTFRVRLPPRGHLPFLSR